MFQRIEGTVDISVITNGFQAIAKDAYSYNCLQTPVITDFNPKVRTIQGNKNINKISHLISYIYVYIYGI